MNDIFVSYKREEQSVARMLADTLEQQGWSVWWDPKLRVGEHFDDAIEMALRDAKCVIVLWSKRSVGSQYVRDEATYALNRRKLVPVTIDGVRPPFRFEGIQTAQLSGWNGSDTFPEFRKLIQALVSVLGPAPRATTEEKRAQMGQTEPVVEEVVLPISGAYKLSEEQWEPDGSLLQMMGAEPPGALLSIKMDSTDSGQYQMDSSVGEFLGRVTVDGEEITIGEDEHEATIGAVVSVDDAHLVTRRIEKDSDEGTFEVTSTWDRLSVTPSADFKASITYTLFIRKLICLKAMCSADVVSLVLGVEDGWTGEIRSGYEVPLGIDVDFTNAETIKLIVWECGATKESISAGGGRAYDSKELTISRRKAGQGQQILRMLPENGDAELFDYEVVYEVLEHSEDR